MMKFLLKIIILALFLIPPSFGFAQEQPLPDVAAAPSVPPVTDSAVAPTVSPQIQPEQQTEGNPNTPPIESAVSPVDLAPQPAAPIIPADLNPDNILNPTTDIERALSEQLLFLNPQINVNNMSSVFLSDWEHDLVTDARMGLTTSGPLPVADAPDQGVRDISLGGIVYRSSSDWTIWLNNARVTPTAIPAQVMDIKVYKEYIELEWLDRSKNLIYPIRLRAHQRFNLDTRMFLPG